MYSIQYGVCNILYCKNFHSSNQVQILSLLNLHFIVSFHEKSGRIIYLLKLFVFQVLNVCHSLLDTLKKHAVWSTKPTQFRHCTWPNFGQMVSITCHLKCVNEKGIRYNIPCSTWRFQDFFSESFRFYPLSLSACLTADSSFS